MHVETCKGPSLLFIFDMGILHEIGRDLSMEWYVAESEGLCLIGSPSYILIF